MTKRNLGGALMALVIAAAVAAFRRRPVKAPEPEGIWRPVPK